MFPIETRVLIADDMVGMRKLIKQNLIQLGFRDIIEAEDGEQAFRKMLEAHLEGKPFGLILSDWRMPKMTGMQLLKTVRDSADFGSVPFLLVTAENEFEQVKEAISMGVNDYLVKPFSSASFKAKLLSAWNKHRETLRAKSAK